jgi:hypothetical protein
MKIERLDQQFLLLELARQGEKSPLNAWKWKEIVLMQRFLAYLKCHL